MAVRVVAILAVTYLSSARELRVAFLAPSTSPYNLNVSSSVGGLVSALDDVLHKYGFLHGHTINVTWYDSGCDNKQAVGLAAEVRSNQDPDVFIGPPCSEAMVPVAALASFWNLPVIGWFSSDQKLTDKSKYTTLVRTFGPLQQLGRIIVSFFRGLGWQRATLVTTFLDESLAISDVIEDYFLSENLRITQTYRMSPKASTDNIKPVLQDIRGHARTELRSYMLAAYDLDMTSGDFVFVAMQLAASEASWRHGNETWQGQDGRDAHARKAMDALLYVSLADNLQMYLRLEEYEAFLADGMHKANNHPWSEVLPPAVRGDIYSTYLYDAVYLWAILVDEMLQEGRSPRDGEELTRRARGKWFNGTSSLDYVTMDNNADRNADFWVLDQNAEGYFRPVALLYWTVENDTAKQKLRIFDEIIWADGSTGAENVPPDSPVCGFDGFLCIDNLAIIIVSVIASLLVLIVLAVSVIIFLYRRRKFERTLSRNLWMVTYDDMKFNIRAHLTSSRRTLATATSMMSMTSGSCDLVSELPRGQMFARAAIYRGTLVAVRMLHQDHIKVTRDLQVGMCKMKEVNHANLNVFVGACIEPHHYCVLWQYCHKGSLQDVIWDENIKLDIQFKLSLVYDIIKGMQYLHGSDLGAHGRLKSSNVLVDSRWSAKVSDYGLTSLMSSDHLDDISDHARYTQMFWTAPELLRSAHASSRGTKSGDVYSFAVVAKELLSRSSPFSEFENLSPRDIVSRIKDYTMPVLLMKRQYMTTAKKRKSKKDTCVLDPVIPQPFRPCLEHVDLKGLQPIQQAALLRLVTSCWAEDPDERPSFGNVHKSFLKWKGKMSTNVLDNMVALLEKYADNLEELVAERTEQLQEEKQKTDMLLYRMLPRSVAEKLKQGQTVQAEWFDDVTIYFSDVVGFTNIAAASTPMQVVALLNALYTLFDDVITHHDVYKVETIGDAYMLVSGLPMRNGGRHVTEVASCALDLRNAVSSRFSIPHLPDTQLRIRIGLHTGACAAGVVGLAMPRYCLFGDTVNTASRMESNGEAMKIHISGATHEALSQFPAYQTSARGELQIKGKGTMTTYWLLGNAELTRPLESHEES